MDNETKVSWDEWDTGRKCSECGRPILRRKLKQECSFMGLRLEADIECQCVSERKERIKRANIEKGHGIIRASMLKNTGLLSRWQRKTFDNFIVRGDQISAYDPCKRFADTFFLDTHQNGLILCGGIGCGKTHLAAAITNQIVLNAPIGDAEAERVGEQGYYSGAYSPVRFTSTIDLLSNIKATYGKKDDGESERAIVQKYQKAPLIILDDLGAEKPTEWTKERLFEIVDYRYSEELPIIITTNRTPKEMMDSLGMRIYDRIKEMCVLVSTAAPSQRKEPNKKF